MMDPSQYPPIDPTTFDLIVVGTGLPESVIAAAASASGKTVLHLDPNSFYGSHFSSLPLFELTAFLNSNSTLDISSSPQLLEEHSPMFNLDVSGPRVLFCADKSIDLLLKSGASQYVDFKSIDACFVGGKDGKLWSVPYSRAAIFQDKNLGLIEKRQLSKFFKLVQSHLAEHQQQEEEVSRIEDEDLESPFVEFLTKMSLPPKIKSIILYAIAMVDYDQDDVKDTKDLLKTKDGIARLALYQSSIGRFTNASGALIYPIYGQGELPQAFCRRAAVKGCIYVLRMPVSSLLTDESSGRYKGVRLASGQDVFSEKLVLDPSFTIPLTPPSPSASAVDPLCEKFQHLSVRGNKMVARGICIMRNSLKPDKSSFLVIYPPRSLYPEQFTSVRALQIGSNFAVCPSGMFVLYLSALCDDANEGKKLLNTVLDALLNSSDSSKYESNSTDQSESPEEGRPTLLWRALYTQEHTKGQVDDMIHVTPGPDGNPNYDDVLEGATKMLRCMYPNEEIFPETSAAAEENTGEDDSGLS